MKIYWKIHSYQKANGTILNNPPFKEEYFSDDEDTDWKK